MSNLANCEKIREMSAIEAAQALKTLAQQIKGPVGLGIWDGALHGKVSGQTYEGEMIAVFRDDDLIAPFGRRGDAESEACAALFALALANADKIAAALAA